MICQVYNLFKCNKIRISGFNLSQIIGMATLHGKVSNLAKRYVDASTQTTTLKKHQCQAKEKYQIPRKILKAQFVLANPFNQPASGKKDRKSLQKLKKEIQELIDFQSARIGLIDIPTNDFPK